MYIKVVTFPSTSRVIRFDVHIRAKRKANKRLTQIADFLLPRPSQTRKTPSHREHKVVN